MGHYKLPVMEKDGFVILKPYEKNIDPKEWETLEYVDWKSGGDTNFAPIASAMGELECGGFWDHGKADKDGIWTSNARICPSLVKWVEDVGARWGRVRIIKLLPQDNTGAMRAMHLDDNNRLNPENEGWVVRAWINLTDDPDSYMILREDKDDPSTEKRIPTPHLSQFVVDTQRLWHAVCHMGTKPRYALITSFESGPVLDNWIQANLPVGVS